MYQSKLSVRTLQLTPFPNAKAPRGVGGFGATLWGAFANKAALSGHSRGKSPGGPSGQGAVQAFPGRLAQPADPHASGDFMGIVREGEARSDRADLLFADKRHISHLVVTAIGPGRCGGLSAVWFGRRLARQVAMPRICGAFEVLYLSEGGEDEIGCVVLGSESHGEVFRRGQVLMENDKIFR